MVPNEWHAWQPSRPQTERRSYNRPYGSYPSTPRPPVQEDTLKELFVQVERKLLTFTLKENARGRFLRITEEANERRNSIIIPATGLDDLQTVVNEMVKAMKEIPSKVEPPSPEAQ